jgi:hypothetical protein
VFEGSLEVVSIGLVISATGIDGSVPAVTDPSHLSWCFSHYSCPPSAL